MATASIFVEMGDLGCKRKLWNGGKSEKCPQNPSMALSLRNLLVAVVWMSEVDGLVTTGSAVVVTEI